MIVEQHTDSIMAQLKSSTQTLHDETEHGTFNDELVKGRLPLANYVDWLGQMFLLHRCLELHLRTHRTQLTMIADVVREYQFQEPYLREDLAISGEIRRRSRHSPRRQHFCERSTRLPQT